MPPALQYSGFRPDDLHLLAKAEINPDDLADPIQRIKIENMIKNKGVLTADGMTILRLVRQTYSKSDLDALTVDQKEQGTSINIIQEGQNRSPNI